MTWKAATDPRSRCLARPDRIGGLLACLCLSLANPLAAQEALTAPARDPVQVYLQAIEQAQSLDGPYAVDLVDLYYGYGQALLEEGDLEAARDAFHRTVLVKRVNSGPNSLDQSNYLYSVADVESRLGNLEEAVSVLQHIYLLHARLYGEDDPAMLPVVEQLYTWYTETKPLRGPLVGASDLQNRSYLAGRIAYLTAARYGPGDVRTAMGYRTEAQLHFRAILHLLRTAEPPQPELVLNSEHRNELVFQRSMGIHFRAGEESFERAVESWRQNPDATVMELAEAIAQLGDYYLALKHFRQAERQYEDAYELLAGSEGSPAVADDYFGSPAPLRFLNNQDAFVRNLDAPVPTEGLHVSMTVTRNGRLLNIEFVQTPGDESQDELMEFKERLESTRFRPAVINGEVESMDDFVWKPILQSPKLAARDG